MMSEYPKQIPVTSIMFDYDAPVERIRKVILWQRKWFRFTGEMAFTQEDPKIDGVVFMGGVPGQDWRCALDLHVTHLHRFCQSDFVMMYNCDGFIIKPEMWTDEFLGWDYVGAPVVEGEWRMRMAYYHQHNPTFKMIPNRSIVGSGGFSLRSRKYVECSAQLRPGPNHLFYFDTESSYLCVEKRAEMESMGIRFCPVGLASLFSRRCDDKRSIDWCFGFEGSKGRADATAVVNSILKDSNEKMLGEQDERVV